MYPNKMLKKLNEAVEMVDCAAHGLERLLQVATVRGAHSPSESRQEAGEVLRCETTSLIAEREVNACFNQGATTSGANIISDFIPQSKPAWINHYISAAAYSNSHHLDSDSDSLSFPREKVAKKHYRGIHQRPWGKQAAEICDPIKGVRVRLGTFSSTEEATCECNRKAHRFHGKKTKVNFPNEEENPKPWDVKSTQSNLNLNSNFAISVPKIEIEMAYSCTEVKELSEELVASGKYMDTCGIPYMEGSRCTEPEGLATDIWNFDDYPASEL